MKNNTFYFFTLVIFSFLLSFLSKELMNTDELIINSLADQLTTEQLNNALDFKDKWQWISYLFIPIITLIKVSLIALILDIGLLFFDELGEIKYNKLFEIIVKSEFIFLFVIIFKPRQEVVSTFTDAFRIAMYSKIDIICQKLYKV